VRNGIREEVLFPPIELNYFPMVNSMLCAIGELLGISKAKIEHCIRLRGRYLIKHSGRLSLR